MLFNHQRFLNIYIKDYLKWANLIKQYIFHCILGKQKFISNGKIIQKELSNRGISTNQQNTCLDIQDDNLCELGYKYYQCFENPKNLSSLL